MLFIRIIIIALPQIFLFLIIGARLDWLGGWNHESRSFDIMVMLFIVIPIFTAALLFGESVRYYRKVKSKDETRSILLPVLALLIFIEALSIDFYMLTQLRM